MAFYETLWYNHVASGKDDSETCFALERMSRHFRAPLRCNLITGECTDEFWRSGAFEGERECDAPDDFTLDFNDRGKDSNEADGTDWGLDDGAWKCADRVCDPVHDRCSWFIWVRGSKYGPDLFDRLFGVRGWFSVIFYMLALLFGGAMLCFAIGCTRCCFSMATRLTDSEFETAARRCKRPTHSAEGRSSHYIARTKVVIADDIDEEDEERYVQQRYLAAGATNARGEGQPSLTGPTPTATGPTPMSTTAPYVILKSQARPPPVPAEDVRTRAPVLHAAGALHGARGFSASGEPVVSMQDRTHHTGPPAYEAVSAEPMDSRRALELT